MKGTAMGCLPYAPGPEQIEATRWGQVPSSSLSKARRPPLSPPCLTLRCRVLWASR